MNPLILLADDSVTFGVNWTTFCSCFLAGAALIAVILFCRWVAARVKAP